MVCVAKWWLICGYHGLANQGVFGLICSKTMVNFRKGSSLHVAPNRKPFVHLKNTDCNIFDEIREHLFLWSTKALIES